MNVLANWHLGRILRLVFGIYAAYLGVFNHDYLSGAIGLFFLYQAFTNTGCCANNACSMPTNTENKQTNDLVEFEEIEVAKKS
jgi:hypothetical protein